MFLYGNFALKPLKIGEIMSNNKIMQFTFSGTQMRKKPTRKRSYFTTESATTAILRDASGKIHHGILFDRRLKTDHRTIYNCPAGISPRRRNPEEAP